MKSEIHRDVGSTWATTATVYQTNSLLSNVKIANKSKSEEKCAPSASYIEGLSSDAV